MLSDLRVMCTAVKVSVTNTFRAVPLWLWLLQLFALAVFQMAFFVFLVGVGGSSEIDVEYVALGNALFSVVFASVYSICAVPGTEKHAGTLPALMITPTRLFTVFIGLSLFQILTALLTVTVSFSFAASLSWIDLNGVNMLSFVCVILVTAFSMAGFGLLLSSIGLFLRSASVLASLAVYVTLVLCGANFPISSLPGFIQVLSYSIPITYGLRALREAVVGGSIAQISPIIGAMLLIGLVLYVLAFLAFQRFERLAKVTGSMELF
jgi:ABC-2 type transport system permease protein